MKIKNRAKEIHFEHIFLDKYAKERNIESGLSDKQLEVPLSILNLAVFFLFILTIIGILTGSVIKLQTVRGEELQALAEKNKYIVANLKSERGIIYDANMIPLVLNEPSFNLIADKSKLVEENKESVIKAVSQITGKSENEIESILASSQENEILIVRDLEHQQLILFETKKEALEGFFVEKSNLRKYEKLVSLSHILGYLGRVSAKEIKKFDDYEMNDYTGKEGIERWYENVLKERKGKVQIERTAQGEEISRKITEEPKSGDSIVLHLDFELQKIIEESLSAVLLDVGSEKGAVVALDPRDGGIIASVSLPGFDNNLFAEGISVEDFEGLNSDPMNPQINRAISGLYPTGSTIKPFIGLAGLEEEIITPRTEIFCPLELCLEHKYTKEAECFPDWQFHGWSNIYRAIAESVNPFFYIIGGGYEIPPKDSDFYDERLPKYFEGLGVERIAKYLKLFAFGKSTGIDLPGEAEGRVPDPDWKETYFRTTESQKWYQGDTYNLSIGQGYLLATPLQLALGFSAIANNGIVFKPSFVRQILTDNEFGQRIMPEIIRENFVSEESIEVIKQGMRQAVSSGAGSAHSLNYLPVSVAAKTGTAQIYPAKEIYHNWIAVFAPYDDPEIVLVVLIEEVEGLRKAAQTVAKDVLQWYFR